jgi:beta-lactamase regulating signal transducer with metallopeptidase domain
MSKQDSITHPAEESAESGPTWSIVALALYALGAFLLCSICARLAICQPITRGSQPIVGEHERLRLGDPGGRGHASTSPLRLCESACVATPVTLGVIAPAIILPATWRQWPAETLRAVLSHECAHVRRRDPLINILAHLNRCVFWFHPLAWWLTRKLATSAEHVCDDAAIRAAGDPRRYAEVLIHMATLTAGTAGGCRGKALIDSEMLDRRIDRVLCGTARQETSATLKGRSRRAALWRSSWWWRVIGNRLPGRLAGQPRPSGNK